jgi:O-antigen/teichoic acid export membrane protein
VKSAWAVCDNALFAVTNLMVALAVARNSSVEEYGTFALAQSIALFISIFHTAFLTEPVLVFGAERYRERVEQYVSAAIVVHIGMFVVIEAVLTVVILVLARLGLSLWPRAFLMAAVGSPFILLGWTLRRACYINRAPQIACLAGVIYIGGLAPLLWVLARSGRLNGLSGFAVMGAAAIPASLWIQARLGAQWRWRQPRVFFHDLLRQHFRYGRWALGAGAMRWVPFNVPLLALASSGSASYSAALRALMTLLLPAVQFFQPVNTMLIPFCAGRSRAMIRKLVARFAIAEIVLALAYSAATWLLSSSLLHLLYAGKYDNYAPYLAPLSLLLLGEAMGGVAASALQALELPSKVFTASLGGALLTLLGTACLHPLTMPAAVRLIVAVYISTATLLALSLYQTLGDRRLVRFEIEEGPWV